MTTTTAPIPLRDRLPWFRPTPGAFPKRPSASATVAQAAAGKPGDAHLSHSQVRAYAGCSLAWYLSRRYQPEFVAASLVFGSSIHAAINSFYQGRLEGRDVSQEDMLTAFSAHWSDEIVGKNSRTPTATPVPVKFTSKEEDEAGMRALAERVLGAFLASVQPGEVVAVEEPFEVTLASDLPPVKGRIDLLEIREDADGVRRLHLVDFKTSARRPTGEDIDADQLLLYALAADEIGWPDDLGLPLALRFDYLTKVKAPELISVPVANTRHGLARFVEKVRQCWRGVRAEVVFPSPSWRCSGCGYSRACGRWPALESAAPPLAASA